MKTVKSLKSQNKRMKKSGEGFIVLRRGHLVYINKKEPREKARQA